MKKKIIIVSCLPWFDECSDQLNKSYQILKISKKKDLTFKNINAYKPDFVFFLHWRWKVGNKIISTFKCINFHCSPLPYGRGGSPIQNMILKKFKKSPLCAIEMTSDFDAGPIYSTRNISLSGNLSDIFNRIATAASQLIVDIIENNRKPKQQKGKSVLFKRLNSSNNEIKKEYTLDQIYDHIRMVDAFDYPRAYIKFGKYKIILKNPEFRKNQITANITISNSDE